MFRKSGSLLALVLILLLTFPFRVLAEVLVNDLPELQASGRTATVDQGKSVTVTYQIVGQGQKCSVTAASPVTVSLGVPSGVSASQMSLTFDSCGSGKGVTFTGTQAGTYAITAAPSDATVKANANFTLVVVSTNTAPSVAVTGVVNGASYEFGSVPAAGCDVTDPEDGSSTFAATLSDITGPKAAKGLGRQTASCAYTDAGDLSASASATYTIVDTTAPTLSLPANQTAEATSAAGAAVTFAAATATDAVDGSVPVTCDYAPGGTFPLGTTTVTCSATDDQGNTATGSFTVTVVDTTPPTLSLPGSLNATATSTAGASVTFSATASDLVDGSVAVTCSKPSGDTFALGTTTVTCTATDSHGNSATGSFTVSVAYAWSNILQPINADGSSIFKLGSTVPVKFRLTGDSAGITDLAARLYVSKISGGVAGTESEAGSTSAADSGNFFRYDPIGGTYIFNLGTKTLEQGTYQIRIDLGDGVSTRTVQFSLRK